MWEKIIEFLDKEAQCETEIAQMISSKSDPERLGWANRIAAKKEICSWLKETIADLIKSPTGK